MEPHLLIIKLSIPYFWPAFQTFSYLYFQYNSKSHTPNSLLKSSYFLYHRLSFHKLFLFYLPSLDLAIQISAMNTYLQSFTFFTKELKLTHLKLYRNHYLPVSFTLMEKNLLSRNEFIYINVKSPQTYMLKPSLYFSSPLK